MPKKEVKTKTCITRAPDHPRSFRLKRFHSTRQTQLKERVSRPEYAQRGCKQKSLLNSIPRPSQKLSIGARFHCTRLMQLTERVSRPEHARKGCEQKNLHNSSTRPSQKLSIGGFSSHKTDAAYSKGFKARACSKRV